MESAGRERTLRPWCIDLFLSSTSPFEGRRVGGGVGLLQPLRLSSSAFPGSLDFCPACCSHRCLPLRNPLGPRSDPLLLPSPPSVTGAAWLCPLCRRLLPAFVPPSLAPSLLLLPISPPDRRHCGSCSPVKPGLATSADSAGLHFPSSPATGTHSTRLRSHTQTHTHRSPPHSFARRGCCQCVALSLLRFAEPSLLPLSS